MDCSNCDCGIIKYTSEDESTYEYVCIHSDYEGDECPLDNPEID